jgi:hypothetical protein
MNWCRNTKQQFQRLKVNGRSGELETVRCWHFFEVEAPRLRRVLLSGLLSPVNAQEAVTKKSKALRAEK